MKEELLMAEKEFIITGTDTIDGYELYNYYFWDSIGWDEKNCMNITNSVKLQKYAEEFGRRHGFDAVVGFKIQDAIKVYGKINSIDYGVGGDGSIHPECFLHASGTFVNIRKKEK